MNMKFLLAGKSCKCKFVNRIVQRSPVAHRIGSPGAWCKRNLSIHRA